MCCGDHSTCRQNAKAEDENIRHGKNRRVTCSAGCLTFFYGTVVAPVLGLLPLLREISPKGPQSEIENGLG